MLDRKTDLTFPSFYLIDYILHVNSACYIIIVYLLLACPLFAQEKHAIDSLSSVYTNEHSADTSKILVISEIAKQYYRNNPDTAILLASHGLELAEAINYDKGKARALNIIGLAHWVKTNHSEALSFYQKALPFFERSKDHQGYALCLNNIGLVYFYQGDDKPAISYLKQSLAIDEKMSYREGAALALNNLGLIYEQQGKLDSALSYYRQALRIYEAQHNRVGIGQSLTNIGYLFASQERYDEALASLRNAIVIQKSVNDRSTLISSLICVADIYKHNGNFVESISNAENALRIAREIKSTYDELEASKVLYEIYKRKNDPENALIYHELFKNLNDSIFSLENNKAIATLEAKATLDKKQKEFETLEKESELRQKIIYITAFALIGMALLTYFIFQNRRRLQSAYNNLTLANSTLEQVKLELEIKATMLDQSNQAKDKMFSVISHDIRSPLNVVTGMFELMEQKKVSAEDFVGYIPDISRRVKHASEIVEELLEWSRAQMQMIEVKKTRIDTNELLVKKVARFTDLAKSKNVALILDVTPDVAPLHADPDMIKAVLRNLVSNAIKFCRPGDTITLQSRFADKHVVLMVSDTGVGIKKENLQRLFQGNGFTTEGTAHEKGTGVGLMLCKNFIEMNDGTIAVESKEGEGTLFTIRLPAYEAKQV
jgi:two-component system, sensor histidine kinase and response regulator